MKENLDIDELLNGFIDGELTERQQTEVKRLIKHDVQIAKRLLELQRCKTLVGSLPCAEAPADTLENIKTSLERRTLLGQQAEYFSGRKGAKHLLARRLTAAAAMLALVSILAVVVYTILAPQEGAEKPVAVEYWRQPPEKDSHLAKSPPAESAVIHETRDKNFNGTLELKTAAVTAVNAFINRAIENNGISEDVVTRTDGSRSIYAVSCSRESLNSLLADLGDIWNKFDSATLFVETDRLGEQVVVNSVEAKQVAEVVNQDSFKNCIKTAKDFAVLNNMTELLPGKEILAAVETERPNLLTIPKPVLTSGEKTVKKPIDKTEDEEKVHLTIILNSR